MTPPKTKGGRPKGEFVTLEEAREWVSRLKLSNYKEWIKFSKRRYHRGKKAGLRLRPRIIPANPQCVYKDEWISDTHFLGHIPYLSYPDAKRVAISLNLKSLAEWLEWHKANKPETIPRIPNAHYKEWESWGKFLGTGNISTASINRGYRPYLEAMKFVHTLNLSSRLQYEEWHRTNGIIDLPLIPRITYKDVWEGWPKYLGKDISAKVEGYNTDVSVLAITQHMEFPGNVYEIRVDRGGKSAVVAEQKDNQFTIIKIYKNEPEYRDQIQQLIARNSSPWWDGNNMYLIQNIHQLLFELDNILLWA